MDTTTHERVVVSIHPDYLRQLSTSQTDLNFCFTCRSAASGHKLSLTGEERSRFMYFIHKFS